MSFAISEILDVLGDETAVGLAVDGHDRGQAAGTHAAQDVEGELAVLGHAALGDVELLLERVEHLLGTLDVAGGSEADGDGVLALGLHREEAVEGHDAVHLADRDSEAVCHDLLDFLGQVAEVVLRLVQDVDQLARVVVEGSADILDLKVIGFTDFYLGSTHGTIIFQGQTSFSCRSSACAAGDATSRSKARRRTPCRSPGSRDSRATCGAAYACRLRRWPRDAP